MLASTPPPRPSWRCCSSRPPTHQHRHRESVLAVLSRGRTIRQDELLMTIFVGRGGSGVYCCQIGRLWLQTWERCVCPVLSVSRRPTTTTRSEEQTSELQSHSFISYA